VPQVEKVLQGVAGTRSAFFERVTDGYYIDYQVKRTEAARYHRLINFAAFPPEDDEFLVTRLWDRYGPAMSFGAQSFETERKDGRQRDQLLSTNCDQPVERRRSAR
jgi:hypothetical protein